VHRRPIPVVTAVLALLAALALALAACGGTGGSGGPNGGTGGNGHVAPGTGAPEGEALIVTRHEGLVVHDLSDNSESVLIPPPVDNAFMLDPSVSLDGRRIAYIVQEPPKIVDGLYDSGSDVWVANRDGSEARMVYEHDQPNQFVRFPQWLDDDHLLAVVLNTSQVEGLTQVRYRLERIAIADGSREMLLDDIFAFAVSPDRQRVAYAVREEGELFEILRAVNLDGSDESTLVPPEMNVNPFNSPQYSPDGALIAFAAADQTGAPPPFGMRGMSAPAAAALDGLPQDVWRIPAGGGEPEVIADLKEDFPAITWSGDGSRIYALGLAALYVIDVASGQVDTIGNGYFHGQLAWLPPA
jgi:hypothetical protein